MDKPFITICMPVYNEVDFIEKTVNMILAQDYPQDRFEIIIADGDSNDGTIEIIKKLQSKHTPIILRKNNRKKSSSGRNICFQTGKGDIFIVIDGHCYIPDNKLFKNIIYYFEKSGAQCLGRPQPLDPPGISNFQEAVAIARSSTIGHGGDSLIYSNYEGFISPLSNGAVYKREVIDKIGYVDESFDACEDVEFNYRVEKEGFKSYMGPDLSIKYYPRENIRFLFQQMMRYGEGRINLLIKYPDTCSFLGFVPLFFVLGLIFLIISVAINSSVSKILASPYIFYFLLICIYSFKLSHYKINELFLNLIKIFPVIHLGLGLGQLKGIYKTFLRK